MTDYLFVDWMTDQRMLEMDFERIAAARVALTGWSDSKVRRVERYLGRIAGFSQSRKGACVVGKRLPRLYLSRLTRSELLAVNILRLAAKGLGYSDGEGDPADKDLYTDEYTRLVAIQSQQQGGRTVREELAPAVEAGRKHREAQSTKARKPRGKGEDKRTIGDLITTLETSNPGETPRELWPRLKSAIENWAGSCEEQTRRTQQVYKYPFGEGHKTISFNHFGERLRQVRREKSTV